jgi:hypothetical protein
MTFRLLDRLVRLAALTVVGLAVATAPSQAAPRRYAFVYFSVTAKPEVAKDVAAVVTPRVEALVKKTLDGGHPQLVKIDVVPEPTDVAGYKQLLKTTKAAGAYLVSVDVTEASEELESMPGKANAQRLTVRIAIHVLGEVMPARTMGFTGDGRATIKQEVGKTVRERDRQYAWDSAAEVAVADALKTVFAQLDAPPKKKR